MENWIEKTIEENQKIIDSLSDVGMGKLIQLEETIVSDVRRYNLLVDTPYEIGVNFIEFVCSEKHIETPMENIYGFDFSSDRELLRHINGNHIKTIKEWVNNIKIGIKNPYSIEGCMNGCVVGNYGKYWRDRLIKEMNRKYDW